MPRPLISAGELASLTGGGSAPTLLDVRWSLGGPPGIGEFRAGHIPGAQYVDLDTELAAPPGPGRHPLPDAARFEAAMRRHGVSAGRPVVVYDAGTSMAAARAWWVLRYFGHPDVRVLDGGFAAWTRAGYDVSMDEAEPHDGNFAADPGHLPLLDAKGAERIAAEALLLDARAPERFRGEVEPVDPVAGHIPGARNLPATANLEPDGRMQPAAAIRRRLDQAGYRPATVVGAYCGSGVTAAHLALALTVAGIEPALYAGSWSEWITDPSRPVALGQD